MENPEAATQKSVVRDQVSGTRWRGGDAEGECGKTENCHPKSGPFKQVHEQSLAQGNTPSRAGPPSVPYCLPHHGEDHPKKSNPFVKFLVFPLFAIGGLSARSCGTE